MHEGNATRILYAGCYYTLISVVNFAQKASVCTKLVLLLAHSPNLFCSDLFLTLFP